MAGRKSFLLRIDAAVLEAMQRWANDDLRSLNGQIEYVLRDAVRRVGRTVGAPPPSAEARPDEADSAPSSDSSETPDSTDSDRQ